MRRALPLVLVAPLLLVAIAFARPAEFPLEPSPDRSRADSIALSRERFVAALRATIAGRENEPAEAVFKDIQILRGLPAGLIPIVMDQGFSNSLGVGCEHCHVPSDWSRPDSATFAITRGMYRMTRRINTELLAAIPELTDRSPEVTCSTCHMGSTLPATRVPSR